MRAIRTAVIVGAAAFATCRGQTTIPHFEVASVKPCEDAGSAAESGVRKGGQSGGAYASPESFYLGCRTVETLIQFAYLGFPSGRPWKPDATGLPSPPISMRQLLAPLKGVPSWVSSAKYTIVAKTSMPETEAMMRGPMMQALLEDRFHLRVHRETRLTPVYLLTVGKSGPKLHPATPGGCVARKPDDETPFVPGQPPWCGWFRGSSQHDSEDSFGQTMDGLALEFSGELDRDMINRTGISGRFDIHLDIPNGPAAPPSDELFSIVTTALKKLGLQVESGKAPVQFLVVDHVERPSQN